MPMPPKRGPRPPKRDARPKEQSVYRHPDAQAQAKIAELTALGATVVVEQADVAQRASMAALIARLARPLRGVIHAAGVLDDGVLRRQSWPRFAKVLAPKVQGAWHLHTLTQALPLDFFLQQPPSYDHKIKFMGMNVAVPSFNYQGYVIWGLTGYMIVELLRRVFRAGCAAVATGGLWPSMISASQAWKGSFWRGARVHRPQSNQGTCPLLRTAAGYQPTSMPPRISSRWMPRYVSGLQGPVCQQDTGPVRAEP